MIVYVYVVMVISVGGVGGGVIVGTAGTVTLAVACNTILDSLVSILSMLNSTYDRIASTRTGTWWHNISKSVITANGTDRDASYSS